MSIILNLSRVELYELVWNTPLSKLVPKFGLSDKGFAKKSHQFDRLTLRFRRQFIAEL